MSRITSLFLIITTVIFAQKVDAVQNVPPVVKIQSPKNGSSFKVGETVIFAGRAIDLEDGELLGKKLNWASDLNGYLGNGNSFNYSKFLPGIHIIVLSATDSKGLAGKDSVFITIYDPNKTEPVKPAEEKKAKDKKEVEVKPQEIKSQSRKDRAPSIEFILVPPIGSLDDLKGKVYNANPKDFVIVVVTMVDFGWWTKPSLEKPVTKINNDGTWVCDITTSERDEAAIKIAAYLIPISYNPPKLSGNFMIPQELGKNSIAKLEVIRKIGGGVEIKQSLKNPDNPQEPNNGNREN